MWRQASTFKAAAARPLCDASSSDMRQFAKGQNLRNGCTPHQPIVAPKKEFGPNSSPPTSPKEPIIRPSLRKDVLTPGMASDRPNGCFHPSSRWLTKAINAPIADGLRMFRTRVELQRSQRVGPDGVSSESAEGIGTATKLSASTSTRSAGPMAERRCSRSPQPATTRPGKARNARRDIIGAIPR